MKFHKMVGLLFLFAGCDALHNIGSIDRSGSDMGPDGSGDCPSDINAAVGKACDRSWLEQCGGCGRCQTCHVLQCSHGTWTAIEVFADSSCYADMRPASTPWTQVSSGTTEYLHGVWGSGDKIFAVGGSTILLSSDFGAHWADVSLMSASGRAFSLSGVWGAGADFFALDGLSSTILHTSDAKKWLIADVQPPVSEPLHVIWGTSAIDFYVAGGYNTVEHFSAEHWSRVALEISYVGAITGWSGGIPGVLFGGVTQIGGHPTIQEQISRQAIRTVVLDQASQGGVKGLWSDDGTNMYAVGFTVPEHALLYSSLNRAGWQKVKGGDADMLESSGQPLEGVFGDGTTVFAVGLGGTIFNWNTLKIESTGTTEHLRAIWGAAGHFVAVGDNGTILVKTVQ